MQHVPEQMTEGIKIRGMYRVQIAEDGEIVGDSGWHQNQVTNDGFNDYLCRLLGNTTSSKQVTHMALGTGTAPGTGATTLDGELDQTSSRAAVTVATSNTSKTVRFTATFSSASSFTSATVTLQNIGLFQQSNTTTATLFAGNTYATSSCATNQNVNATYDITFS